MRGVNGWRNFGGKFLEIVGVDLVRKSFPFAFDRFVYPLDSFMPSFLTKIVCWLFLYVGWFYYFFFFDDSLFFRFFFLFLCCSCKTFVNFYTTCLCIRIKVYLVFTILFRIPFVSLLVNVFALSKEKWSPAYKLILFSIVAYYISYTLASKSTINDLQDFNDYCCGIPLPTIRILLLVVIRIY